MVEFEEILEKFKEEYLTISTSDEVTADIAVKSKEYYKTVMEQASDLRVSFQTQ